MRVVASFSPLQYSWIVAASELFGSSSGHILIAVVDDQFRFPVWNNIRLWNQSAFDTGKYDSLRDAQYASSRVFQSTWFGGNSMAKYSAYVGVSVDVEADMDLPQYSFAFGSVSAKLSSIKIQQCLMP